MTGGMFVSAVLVSDFSCLSNYAPQKGPMDILAQTVRREGILALYKGSFSQLTTHS